MKITHITPAILLLAASPASAASGSISEIAAPLAAISYTQQHCPQMRLNKAAWGAMFNTIGVTSMEDIPTAAMQRALEYKANMEAEPASAVCGRIWDNFGAGGSIAPDLFLRQ